MKKKLTGVALVLAAVSLMGIQPAGACTRAVYSWAGPNGGHWSHDGLERRHYVKYLCVSTWNAACGTQ